MTESIKEVDFDEYVRLPNPVANVKRVHAKDADLSTDALGVHVRVKANGATAFVPWARVTVVLFAPSLAAAPHPGLAKAKSVA